MKVNIIDNITRQGSLNIDNARLIIRDGIIQVRWGGDRLDNKLWYRCLYNVKITCKKSIWTIKVLK